MEHITDSPYFFNYGDIFRKTPYEPPTISTLKKWRDLWFSTVDLSNFKIMSMGSTVERLYGCSIFEPKDVDVFFTGDYSDSHHLRDVLRKGLLAGEKFNLKIDLIYTNVDVYNTLFWEKDYFYIKYSPSTIEYVNGRVNVNEFVKVETEILDSGIIKIFLPDSKVSQSLSKHMNRIYDGQYKSLRLDLHTMKLLPFNYYNQR